GADRQHAWVGRVVGVLGRARVQGIDRVDVLLDHEQRRGPEVVVRVLGRERLAAARGGHGGGTGGAGEGGGLYSQPTATATIRHSIPARNQANGGPGISIGAGQGGGVFIVASGAVCVDVFTIITANVASTSDDDVFGTLCLI